MPLYIVLCCTICTQVCWRIKGLNRSFLMKFEHGNLRTRKLYAKCLTQFIGTKQTSIIIYKYQNKKWDQHIFHRTYLEIKIIFHVQE